MMLKGQARQTVMIISFSHIREEQMGKLFASPFNSSNVSGHTTRETIAITRDIASVRSG